MTAVATEESLTLSEDEAQAVAEMATAYATAVPPGRGAPYVALALAAHSGSVSGEDLETLQRVVVLSLETGKAHRLGLAETEQLIAAVYRRTPLGRARIAETHDINQAMAQLAGRPLTAAKISSQRPGRYSINLSVTGFDLTLVIDPSGIEVQSLQTG